MNVMKRVLALFLSVASLGVYAQAPAESEDVMLQGFYWNSQRQTGWTQLTDQAADIAKSFNLIWLPPSASAEGGGAVGGNNMGYHPRQWNNQTSCWGTAEQLKTLISTLHNSNVKVIADIVVNHRAGDTGWGNFTKDDFGTYGSYQLTTDHICSNDEMNTNPSAGSWYGTAKGAKDTGENWDGARDLDHTSTYVQQDIEAYLNWLHGEYGYDGWRYDFCKGYNGKYVGLFNEATQPYLSVGEYWDGSYDPVAAWIVATGKQSMAFDYPAKYAALNNGLAKNNFSNMSWIEDKTTWRPAGMIHHHNYNRYSVTFVDNHDTYRDSNKYTGNVQAAYAFILSSPGIPCVFYPHWVGADRDAINQMIAIRRQAGVHSESNVTVTARSQYYESHAVGHHGTLITRIGAAAPTTVPEGYTLVASGAQWQMFLPTELAAVHAVTASDNALRVNAQNGQLTINNPQGHTFQVFNTDGRLLHQSSATSCTLSLPAAPYVVKSGKEVKKVSVR